MTDAAFVGHVGGDDFVVVMQPELAVPAADAIVAAFDAAVSGYYDDADRERGYIEVTESPWGAPAIRRGDHVDRHREHRRSERSSTTPKPSRSRPR